MAKKGGMPTFRKVDDYITAQSKEAQIILKEIRHLIKKAVPEVIELENSKVPTFMLVPDSKIKQQLMVVAYASYISFYPFQATVNHFVEKLSDFKLGKGTVKFPYNKPLPKDLIVKMIKFRKDEISNT